MTQAPTTFDSNTHYSMKHMKLTLVNIKILQSPFFNKALSCSFSWRFESERKLVDKVTLELLIKYTEANYHYTSLP